MSEELTGQYRLGYGSEGRSRRRGNLTLFLPLAKPPPRCLQASPSLGHKYGVQGGNVPNEPDNFVFTDRDGNPCSIASGVGGPEERPWLRLGPEGRLMELDQGQVEQLMGHLRTFVTTGSIVPAAPTTVLTEAMKGHVLSCIDNFVTNTWDISRQDIEFAEAAGMVIYEILNAWESSIDMWASFVEEEPSPWAAEHIPQVTKEVMHDEVVPFIREEVQRRQ